MMSSGFDERVEARLIGLRMADDAPSNVKPPNTGSGNLSLSNETIFPENTDNRSPSYNQSPTSPVFNSLTSSHSSNSSSNAPVTARRSVSFVR